MTPREQAVEFCKREYPLRTLDEIEAGYDKPWRHIVSTDKIYMLVRPISSCATWAEVQTEQEWSFGTWDTWFVFLFCGSLRDLWPHMPYYLPYAAWHRAKTQTLHFHKLNRIQGLTTIHHGG